MKDLACRTVPSVPSLAALPAPTQALAGALLRVAPTRQLLWCDGSAWLDVSAEPRLSTARLGSDVSNAATTLAPAGALALALNPNSTYQVEAQVLFQTAATTTGIRLTQTVPAGASVAAQWNTPTSLTASAQSFQRAADAGAATAGIDAANAPTLARASLLVITGATAGNLQIRFASEVAASGVVIKAGSNLVAIQVA